MPELPEVETIKRDLVKQIKGKRIKTVDVKVPKMVNCSVARFKNLVAKSIVQDIKRRAKLLIFQLSSGRYMLIHLKMTGQLIYRKKDGKVKAVGGHPIKQNLAKLPNRFSHVIFTFTDGSHLFFNDIRKFGYVKLVQKVELDELLAKNYGPEPLQADFNVSYLGKILQKRPKAKIKQLLLEQKLISGIGNIYADESLFCASIHPTRLAGQVQNSEIKKLHSCIKKILKLAINKRGTSVENYVDASGRQGGMVPYLKVYRRAGGKCKRCGGKIKKIVVGGRGTHYCARCQD